ncbi:MAG: SDR family oxidoreductase [Microthrixaceae bacterium]
MDLGLRDRRAAVAAASGGLGFAAAASLAREGARVVVCGRDRGRIDDAAERVGHGCVGVVADVGTADGATAFVEQATDVLGGLDIVVPNAGGPPAGTFESTPPEEYLPALELNLMSVVTMCRAAVPAMRRQGWGRVVAITSLAVRQPMVNLILSNTARAGATAFLKTLAREVAADGVTVNSVQPGLHHTARVKALYGDGEVPGPMGDPADFGEIVTFLCSEQARFVTGTALHVDGGAYLGLM